LAVCDRGSGQHERCQGDEDEQRSSHERNLLLGRVSDFRPIHAPSVGDQLDPRPPPGADQKYRDVLRTDRAAVAIEVACPAQVASLVARACSADRYHDRMQARRAD
jgi:hypothetical protein